MMTREWIRNAVAELRNTLRIQWGSGSPMYKADNRALVLLARAAYKSVTHEAQLRHKDEQIETLLAVIELYKDEIRRLASPLKDCIAAIHTEKYALGPNETWAMTVERVAAGVGTHPAPTSDPKVAAFTVAEYVDLLGPLKST